MTTEVVFYSLAPKPAASGAKTYAAAAAGKVARGRKWLRLESRPDDVYQFPDGTSKWDVWDWLEKNPAAMRWRVAFLLDGRFYKVDSFVLASIPGGYAARDNAISLYEKGKEGWVVFIPINN